MKDGEVILMAPRETSPCYFFIKKGGIPGNFFAIGFIIDAEYKIVSTSVRTIIYSASIMKPKSLIDKMDLLKEVRHI